MILLETAASGLPLVEIGVGGTFALLVIDRFIAFVRSRNGASVTGHPPKGLRMRPEDYSVEFDELLRLVREIHEEAVTTVTNRSSRIDQ